MKLTFAAMLMALMVVGCDRSSPVDSSSSSASVAQSDATFGELSMLKTTLNGTGLTVAADTGVCPHDSLRNVYMLDSLKAYLGLTDDQFTSLKGFGTTLTTSLSDIRTQIMSHGISRDSAQVLVKAARDQFVASVKSILTAAQLTSFDTWLTLYWNKPPQRGVPGGHPGHGGPGGRGGHDGHGGPGGPPGGGPGGEPRHP